MYSEYIENFVPSTYGCIASCIIYFSSICVVTCRKTVLAHSPITYVQIYFYACLKLWMEANGWKGLFKFLRLNTSWKILIQHSCFWAKQNFQLKLVNKGVRMYNFRNFIILQLASKNVMFHNSSLIFAQIRTSAVHVGCGFSHHPFFRSSQTKKIVVSVKYK